MFEKKIYSLAITLPDSDICQLWPSSGSVLMEGLGVDPLDPLIPLVPLLATMLIDMTKNCDDAEILKNRMNMGNNRKKNGKR